MNRDFPSTTGEKEKYLNVASSIPGIFAECKAKHYRVYKVINLLKGVSKKTPEKVAVLVLSNTNLLWHAMPIWQK